MRNLDGFKKGVNLGGWLSQGPLDKEHLDTFITEKDIAVLLSHSISSLSFCLSSVIFIYLYHTFVI